MLGAVLLLSACTPTYDWREVQGPDASYVVTLPSKPSSQSRSVELAGSRATMHMNVASAGGATFAVATARLANNDEALAALQAMKTALVKNINGKIVQEKAVAARTATETVELEALGPPAKQGDQPRRLIARFVIDNQRVFQLAVVGGEDSISRDAVDTFFTSFKSY